MLRIFNNNFIYLELSNYSVNYYYGNFNFICTGLFYNSTFNYVLSTFRRLKNEWVWLENVHYFLLDKMRLFSQIYYYLKEQLPYLKI
jgi:hypothetical protein